MAQTIVEFRGDRLNREQRLKEFEALGHEDYKGDDDRAYKAVRKAVDSDPQFKSNECKTYIISFSPAPDYEGMIRVAVMDFETSLSVYYKASEISFPGPTSAKKPTAAEKAAIKKAADEKAAEEKAAADEKAAAENGASQGPAPK